jgi:signal transduction histidine kinase
MNILASVTTPTGRAAPGDLAAPEPQPSQDLALAGAIRIVAGDLRSFLANLGILTEVAEARSYCRSLASRHPSARADRDLVQRLDDMMTSIIHNTRRTGDPFGFHSRLTDLQDILDLAFSLNRPLAENKGVVLVDDGARPVTLSADRQLLLEAADVLVAHAIRRSPPNGRVTCLAERRRGLALIHVADGGEAMTEAGIARALSPFASPPTARHGAGRLDLELWFARLIAERHGGRIIADTPIGGRGNLFTLSLPAELH